MILPEFALLVCALCRFGGPRRLPNPALVDDREVLVRVFDLAGLDIVVRYLALRAKCKISAVGSLKIRELDEVDRRIGSAARPAGASNVGV
jgi:hypothetical protein